MWVTGTRPRLKTGLAAAAAAAIAASSMPARESCRRSRRTRSFLPWSQTFDKPKIAMPAAIDVQKDIKLPDNPNLPIIGMKSGVNVVLSNGTGGGGGMGSGSGGGLGSGNGNGYGPGSGWNTGGGLYQVGGRVSAPIVLIQPEAEFSDEARRAKYQGVCLVWPDRRCPGQSAERPHGPRPGHGPGREGDGSGPQIQVQAGDA